MIRIATFNVENLFERPKVFNFKDRSIGDEILEKVNNLRSLLLEETYTDSIKLQIFELYNEVKDFILVREDQGKLFKRRGWAVTGVKADGVGDWNGSIEYKKARFSSMARNNTAKVFKKVKADIACVIEADNRIGLKRFDSHLLGPRYNYEMLIDGNDRRGIDVGILSKHVFGKLRTHIYDRVGGKVVFSRDCLEAEVLLPGGRSLYLLVNHFKSKGYDMDGTADAKRKRQADRVKQILNKYDLTQDYVIVAGDLNDTPGSNALRGLLNLNNLHDVLELKYGNDHSQRWTYHYDSFEQIDFLLVSEALKNNFLDAGVERRGMYNLKKLTTDSNGDVPIETQFSSVTHWSNQASDHGAVWADFDI